MARKKKKKRFSIIKRYLIGYSLLLCAMGVFLYWAWGNLLSSYQRNLIRKQVGPIIENVRERTDPFLTDLMDHYEEFRGNLESDEVDSEKYYSYGGFPSRISYPNTIRILHNDGFVVGYDEKRRNPAWVSYRLFHVKEPREYPRPSGFEIDIRTRSKVSSSWYTRSGYDRGHLAPNYGISICYGEQAQEQTFLMSNICPQEPDLNRGLWKSLEMKTIKDYTRRFGNIWITTGPLYDNDKERLKSKLEIPDGFFKILIDERGGKPRAMAIMVNESPSGSITLRQCLVSIDAIESTSGLDFLSQLDNDLESRLENKVAEAIW